jgi:DNA polymerase V
MALFALVDCNNFFVSCERVFAPKLAKKPVVVLSSNDACVIARSNEVKALGVKMGEPYFACKDILAAHQTGVFSSNFALYGDMSCRVMQVLSKFAFEIEKYSIDEAFLSVEQNGSSNLTLNDCLAYARKIRHKVKQNTGIPVSVGIGTTKTLAKIANHLAKKNSKQGVFVLSEQHLPEDFNNILKNFAVEDIWGIGRKYAKKLKSYQINNAYDLMQANDIWIKKNLTINGLKTVLELRGVSCLSLEDIDDKKSITVSRSFGKSINNLAQLKEALASYISIAAEKLRKQNANAGAVTVFICYAHYGMTERYYDSTFLELSLHTSYTPDLIKYANLCLTKIYKNGVIYKKVGVILSNFYPQKQVQYNLFKNMPNLQKQNSLMKTLDDLNLKFGRDQVFFGACGLDNSWQNRKNYKSPNFTTNWHDILTIKI